MHLPWPRVEGLLSGSGLGKRRHRTFGTGQHWGADLDQAAAGGQCAARSEAHRRRDHRWCVGRWPDNLSKAQNEWIGTQGGRCETPPRNLGCGRVVGGTDLGHHHSRELGEAAECTDRGSYPSLRLFHGRCGPIPPPDRASGRVERPANGNLPPGREPTAKPRTKGYREAASVYTK